MKPVPFHKQQNITIFDTTLRDGEQWAGGALSVQEKFQLAQQMATAKVDVIEAGFAASSQRDFDSVYKIAKEVEGPVIASLARAHEGDIKRAAEALAPAKRQRIHIFIATSDQHMRDKLLMSRERVLQKTDEMVRFAKQCVGHRGDVEWSAEDATRSDPDFLAKAVCVAINAGATTINLPDTLGFENPRNYRDMFRNVIRAAKPAANIVFSAHVHDDRGYALANSMAAIEGGARQVECTILGVGERAGNTALEQVVFNLRFDERSPFTCNTSKELVPLAQLYKSFISDTSGIAAVVGSNAFAHGSGIHQHGMVNGNCYEYVRPSDYGHKGSRLLLTVHSGIAGIKANLDRLDVKMDEDQLKRFAQPFKDCAGELVDKKGLRTVPDELAREWAHTFLSGNTPKVA